MAEDNDVSLPKASLTKLIKESMPPDIRVAGDTMDLLMNCCVEFVQLVSSQANEVSTEEKKNTITPEHVLKALEVLGFEGFLTEVTATYDQWKQDNKAQRSHNNLKKPKDECGMSEEEMIALQQRMFAEARARSYSAQMPDAVKQEPPAS